MVSLSKNETKMGRKAPGEMLSCALFVPHRPTGSLRRRHRRCSRQAQYLALGPQAGRHVEVAVGMGPGTGKELQPVACPKGMCLSSPGGRRPQGLEGWVRNVQGRGGFSPTQSLPEPPGSPMTLHLTRHVSCHMPRLVRCRMPSRCANSTHRPLGTAGPCGCCLLSNQNITCRCYGKSNSIRQFHAGVENGPEGGP